MSCDADWIWGEPLAPGSSVGEYQIFRTKVGTANVANVPEPGTLGLFSLVIATLAMAYKRSKK